MALVNVGDLEGGAVTLSDAARWRGHVGADGFHYRAISPAPSGVEDQVTWTFDSLSSARAYQVYVNWDPDPELASNAVYHVHGAVPAGRGTGSVQVDQRYVPGEYRWGGRTWRSLGFYVPENGAGSLRVRLTTTGRDGRPSTAACPPER